MKLGKTEVRVPADELKYIFDPLRDWDYETAWKRCAECAAKHGLPEIPPGSGVRYSVSHDEMFTVVPIAEK